MASSALAGASIRPWPVPPPPGGLGGGEPSRRHMALRYLALNPRGKKEHARRGKNPFEDIHDTLVYLCKSYLAVGAAAPRSAYSYATTHWFGQTPSCPQLTREEETIIGPEGFAFSAADASITESRLRRREAPPLGRGYGQEGTSVW